MSYTNGKCLGCFMSIKEEDSLAHIKSCEKINSSLNNGKVNKTECFLVKVYSQDDPFTYWMDVAVPHKTTVKELENFIIDTWLECCGHMRVWYNLKGDVGGCSEDEDGEFSSFDDLEEGKDKPIKQLVELNKVVGLEYDMGTPTTVAIYFYSNLTYTMMKPSIKVLVRNVQPNIYCQECKSKKTSTKMHFGVPKCKKCSQRVAKDELLPMCNSPRTGQCGYLSNDKISPIYLP